MKEKNKNHKNQLGEDNINIVAKNISETETAEDISLQYENKRELVKSGVLGAFIGLAIIVPGVSGSTVAIIFRLYEKLLYALGNLFKKFKTPYAVLSKKAFGTSASTLLSQHSSHPSRSSIFLIS